MIEEAMMAESKPIDHVQDMQDENWQGAMIEELKAIEKNQTWESVTQLNKKAIDVRWVYKLKLKPNNWWEWWT